jgi:hypothetical protein
MSSQIQGNNDDVASISRNHGGGLRRIGSILLNDQGLSSLGIAGLIEERPAMSRFAA